MLNALQKYSKAGLAILILSVVLLSFLRDCSLLFQTSAATGIDGYYYVLQIESLINTGRLYFSTDTPLFLYILSGFRLLTADTVTAIKLGGLIFHFFLSLGVFFLVTALTKSRRWGICGLLLANVSNLHLYFITEFLSNLSALTFIIWSAFFLVKAVQTNKRKFFALFVLCLLSAVFSHRSALYLLILIGFTFALAYLLTGNSDNPARRKLLLLSVALITISPLIIARQSFFSVPEPVSAEVLRVPQLPFGQTNPGEFIALTIICLVTAFLFIFYFELFKNNLAGAVLITVCLIGLFLTFNPFLNHRGFITITGRLSNLSYIQMSVAVPLFLFLARKISGKLKNALILALTPFILSGFFTPLPVGFRPEYVQRREKLAGQLHEIKSSLCEDSLIIAPHGEQFLVTAITGFPSQQIPPEADSQSCVYWLIHRRNPEEIIELSDSIQSPRADFILAKHEVVKRNIASFAGGENRDLLAVNPHLRKFIVSRTNTENR
jgi:hypothetical protein